MSRVVELRTDKLRPIEAAAQILSWIVYPTDEGRRERWANAVVLLALRKAAQRDPRWQTEEVPIRVGVLLQDPSVAERQNKHASLILRDRILAGNMAVPLIAKAARITVKFAPDGSDLSSLNQIAAKLAELIGGKGGGDVGNVKTRIWRESKPVLHLCAALAAILLRYWRDRWDKNLWGLLEDPDVICELVETAEMCRPVIAGWRKPGPTVDPAQQIEIRLVS